MSGAIQDEKFDPSLRVGDLGRIAFPAVLVFAAGLYLAQLGSRALWSEELRWAQIPKEMLQKQDYFSPTINGKSYYDKPLGAYWLVLLASKLTGKMDEVAARLPCVFSGVISVAFTMLIAYRFYPVQTAIWSGIILATSHSFVFFSRHASTDMETIAGVLACLWLFLRNESNPRGRWIMLFWIMMALTSLTKGLLGFALPCLVCFVYSTARRFDTLLSQPGALSKVKECLRANEWFFQWQSVVAIPLALLTYLAPFLISAFWFGDFEGLGMVWRENIRRFYNPVNHIGPMYLYFVVIFTLMAPWSVFLPAALTQAIFGKKSPKPIQQNHLFALCYFLSVFIFFTLASSRRSYYLLPILPSAAWLIAGLISSDRAFLNKTVRFLLNLAIVFMILASVGLLFPVFPGSQVLPQPWNQFPALPQGWFLVVTSLVVITCLVLSLLKPVRVSPFFGVAAFAFLIMVYLFHLYYPWAESFRTQREFASRVRSLIGEKVESLSYYRTREAVFYLDMAGPVQEFYTPETLLSAVAGGKTRWVILKKQEIQRIPKSVNILVEEPSFPWEGSQASSKLALVEFSN